MPAAAPVQDPATAKAHAAAVDRLDTALKALDVVVAGIGRSDVRAESAAEVKALRSRATAHRKTVGKAQVNALLALAAEAKKLEPAITRRWQEAWLKARRTELQGQVNASLAGALLEIGKLQEPLLVKQMFAEQAAMKARMNKAEKSKRDLDAVSDMDDLDDEMPALMQRIAAARTVSDWLVKSFRPMLVKVTAAIDAIADAKQKKAMQAELQFVQQAKEQALASLDPKKVESATLPALRTLLQTVQAHAGKTAMAGKTRAAKAAA